MYDASTSIKTPGVGGKDVWVAELTRRGADAPTEIVDAYIRYGAQIGYNHDLAIAQGVVECTGFTDYKWLQFRNPAGIGSTSRDVPGNVFPSIAAGITAQYAHQAAYAETADSCPIEKMDAPDLFNDPRHVFHRGTPAISAWNGAWAVPGTTYAESICAVANAVVGEAPPVPQPPPPQPGGKPLEIIDVRDQLPTGPGGSHQTFSPKRGIIWHYTGPAVNMDADEMTMLRSYANFHMGPYLGEGGIAYHYDIAPDGTVRLMRNPDAVLWHCGAWPENQTHYAVHIELGEGQNATPAQIASAVGLADVLRAQDGFGYEQCKGHREVSSTACPGSLMDDLVYPYRRGDMQVSDRVQFSETGHGIDGAIRRHFEHNGGVVVFGFPISEVMQDPFGGPLQVQFFEGGILELHPENPAPNDVQRRRLGAQAAVAANLTGPGVQFP